MDLTGQNSGVSNTVENNLFEHQNISKKQVKTSFKQQSAVRKTKTSKTSKTTFTTTIKLVFLRIGYSQGGN